MPYRERAFVIEVWDEVMRSPISLARAFDEGRSRKIREVAEDSSFDQACALGPVR